MATLAPRLDATLHLGDAVRADSGSEPVSHQAVTLLGFLMKPAALSAYALGFWRLGDDIGWTGDFFIGSGLLSHWQVWVGIGAAIHAASSALTKLWIQGRQLLP